MALIARLAAGGQSAIEADILAEVGIMNDAMGNSDISGLSYHLLGTIEDVDYSNRDANSVG